jgi:hypothetical protein
LNAFVQGLKEAADATGVDQTQAREGFERTVYPEGPVKLRYIGYVELGVHEKTYQNSPPKDVPLVRFAFEVSGPKHKPVVIDGKSYPLIAYIEETLSQDTKANFMKVFNLLNHDKSAKHAVYKLGEAYIGNLVHRKWKRAKDPADSDKWTGLDYKLRGEAGYNIRAPFRDDPDSGEKIAVQVDPPITALHGFLWDKPTMAQWESLFIPGEWPERKDEKSGKVIAAARSKNVVQERIMRAKNFKGSPIYALLMQAGVNLELPPPEVEEEAAEGGEAGAEKPAAPAKQPAKVESGAKAAAPEDDDIPW